MTEVDTTEIVEETAAGGEEEELTEYTSEEVTEYSSESAAGRFAEAVPGAGLGRRKEAIARVRIVPGTGKW